MVSRAKRYAYVVADGEFLEQAAAVVANDQDVDREAATAIQRHPGPPTRDGLLRAHETLMWRLEASAHELTVILEERRFALAQVSRIDETLGEMGESEGSGSEDEEDSSEDGSEGDDGDVEQLAGGFP